MLGHPWMVQGCQSYYGLQGYSDRVVGSECGPSIDGPGMSELLWCTGILWQGGRQ